MVVTVEEKGELRSIDTLTVRGNGMGGGRVPG